MTIGTVLHRVGLVSATLHAASLGSIGLCLALWIRAKTVDQEERGNAERRAIFVGLWPPMLWLLGDTVRDSALRTSVRVTSGLDFLASPRTLSRRRVREIDDYYLSAPEQDG